MFETSSVPVEQTMIMTPAELRRIADLITSGEATPLGASLRSEAAELRAIADRLERDGVYSVVRPATRITYRVP